MAVSMVASDENSEVWGHHVCCCGDTLGRLFLTEFLSLIPKNTENTLYSVKFSSNLHKKKIYLVPFWMRRKRN